MVHKMEALFWILLSLSLTEWEFWNIGQSIGSKQNKTGVDNFYILFGQFTFVIVDNNNDSYGVVSGYHSLFEVIIYHHKITTC